jgi:hypothetical protein
MTDIRSKLAQDYFVVATGPDRGLRWAWEIHRKSKPLGVKLTQADFRTEQAAKLAGEKALKSFLGRLSKEGT